MALIDKLTEFGDKFSLTLATGTHLMTTVLNLGAAGEPIGNGGQLWLNVLFTTSTNSAANGETVQFRMASDDSAAIHATASTGHFLSPPLAQADMVKGKGYSWAVPAGIDPEQYLGVQCIVGGEAITAGAVSAWLSTHPHQWQALPDAIK